jgi:hypothetical protein
MAAFSEATGAFSPQGRNATLVIMGVVLLPTDE